MKKKREAVWLAVLPALAVFLIAANLCSGSVHIPAQDLWAGLAAGDNGEVIPAILWRIRLPRALAAFLLGGALALSGYLMQTYFHNPIAGPYVLGVSSGAKLFVAAAMIAFLGAGKRCGAITLITAAFAGALFSMSFVLAMSRVLRSMSMLMVAGIMTGYICSAVTDLIVAFADDADIVSLHGWSKGSFSGMDWEGVAIMALITILSLGAVFLLSKPISAYLMGEEYARSLGVDVRRLRIAIIILSSLLAAVVTAYAGPVSFVGIAVPRIIHLLMGEGRPHTRIPACFFGGGVFCLVCDLIARLIFAPTELSISTVTAILGAPVVIWVLLGRRKREAVRTAASQSGTGLSEGAETAEAARGEDGLEVRGLCVGYEGRAVVTGIEAKAGPGELVALIGANGAGKSTLLKTLGGFLSPVAGSIRLRGEELFCLKPSDRARKVSVLLTDTRIRPGISCRDMVAMGRYPYTGLFGLPGEEDNRAIDSALDLTDCAKLAYMDFSKLSDGQRQRVLLARALCQEPELLLLDEPTAFLDIRYRIEILALLQRLARKQRFTVVFSIHSPSLALAASDRVYALKNGICRLFLSRGPGEDKAELSDGAGIWELFDMGETDFDEEVNKRLFDYARAYAKPKDL